MVTVAIIGGTGLNRLPGLECSAEHSIKTPWGETSHPIQEGRLQGRPAYFLARHGVPHRIPPHAINYRANIRALRELGVDEVVGINAVGGIDPAHVPGHLVVADQLIDYTWGREHTFFDGAGADLRHIDFTSPYDADMRSRLIACATELGLGFSPTGTYGVTQGPRLETAAEVRRLGADGCDVVGMTGMPEAALAVEAGLRYAAVCMVVNPAAGLSEAPIAETDILAIVEREAAAIAELLAAFLRAGAG